MRLIRSPLRRLYDAYRRQRSGREFTRLISGLPRQRAPLPSPAESLLTRRGHRRPISRVPRVLALGHQSWESSGLWPSFQRVSDFELVPVGAEGGQWGARQRQDTGRRVLESVERLDRQRPVELVFIYCSSMFVDPALLQELSRRGIWTVVMGLDDKHRYVSRRVFGMTVGQSTVAPRVDLYWTTWRAGAHVVAQHGGTPWYAPEAADPAFHRPLSLEREIEVLFIGARYGQRARIVDYLRDQGFGVQAYGRGWPNGFVSFDTTIELFNRAQVVLGVGGVGPIPEVQHLKGRDFEVPMCGALYLTTYNPELADWFDIGREILCYSSLKNCAETLHWILRRPDIQQQIRAAALARSLRQHTWEQRLRQMLALFPGAGEGDQA